MPHAYDTQFMDYTARSSRHSARTIVTPLRDALAPGSILDIGCARGTWLDEWRAVGVADVFGVDGDYVNPAQLMIPADRFKAADLSRSIDLGRRFDLVQSLEVAEHVAGDAADTFVGNLVAHASGAILFSAAPPGQGGEFHVNEQPYEYWRAKFSSHGYTPYDCVRPLIAHDREVSFWYRYNTLLYLTADRAASVPKAIRSARVADTSPIADVSPRLFRLRKTMVRVLPFGVQQMLARWKARIYPAR
jgi:SAM-dependent methyltransferase